MSQKSKITIGVIVSIALVAGIGGAFMMQSDQVSQPAVVVDKQQDKPMLVDDQAKQNQIEKEQAESSQAGVEDIEVITVSTLYREMLPDEVIDEAKYAIIGKVAKLQPMRIEMPDDNDQDEVHTIVTLKVKEDLFDNYPLKKIQFRVQGGEASGLRMIAEDGPAFQKGEVVLVFLGMGEEQEYPFGDELYLIAGEQGVFDYLEINEKIQDRFLNKEYDQKDLIKMVKKEKGSK